MNSSGSSDIKRRKKRRKKRRFPAFVGVILAAIAVFVGVSAAFHTFADGLKDGSSLLPPGAFDSTAGGVTADRLNFLLIGTDGSNSRTDTIMLASLDFVDRKINLISIPRDTRVLVNGKYHKINACAVIGGDELLINTVRDITGAPIHYYVKASFTGFRNIIDLLGGVDYYVPMDMHYSDPYQNLYIDLKEGQQHLDGDKAEQLVRFRRYPEADIQRTRVQKDFLKELLKQKLTAEYFFRAPSLYSDISKNITTNFTAGDMMKHLDIIKLFQDATDETITAYEMPGSARMIGGASYWIHDVEQTLELSKEYFGGSGTSKVKSTYAAAEQSAISSAPKATAADNAAVLSESDSTDEEGLPADDIEMFLDGELDENGEPIAGTGDITGEEGAESGDAAADAQSGDTNTGDAHTGDTNTGNAHTGDTHTGDTNTGDAHTGDTHTGDTNTGDTQSGSEGGSTSQTEPAPPAADTPPAPPADEPAHDISTPPEWLR